MAFSFAQLDELMTNAKREAMIADLTCNGWDYEDGHLKSKGWTYTGTYTPTRTWEVTISVEGSVISAGAATDSEAEGCANAVKGAIAKWDTQIDDVAWGWQEYQIPDPESFNTPIASTEKAVKDLSSNTGNDHSKLGNPNLEAIGNMRDLFPNDAAATGATVSAFYQLYGPNRLETVLDGHCEAAACLFVGLSGEKDVWTKARQDVADTFGNCVAAFTATQKNHPTEWQSLLKVVTAAVGLTAAWMTGPAAPVVAAFAATGGFLSTAADELKATGALPEQTTNSDSTPDSVYASLQQAMKDLSTSIKSREQAIGRMLDTMLKSVNDPANRDNFHVNAKKGLDPSFAHSDDIIDVKFPVLRSVGYTMMPLVASAFYDGSDAALAANSTYPWYRLAWGLAPEGAYESWKGLLYQVYPLMDDNGAEIVKAGEHLGEAAGYLKAADERGEDALGKHVKEVNGAKLGWTPAHVDPPPPPPEPRHGGRQPTY